MKKRLTLFLLSLSMLPMVSIGATDFEQRTNIIPAEESKRKRSNDFSSEGDEDYNGYDEWSEVSGGIDKRSDLTRKLKNEKKNNIFLKAFDKTLGKIPGASNLPKGVKYGIEGLFTLIPIILTSRISSSNKDDSPIENASYTLNTQNMLDNNSLKSNFGWDVYNNDEAKSSPDAYALLAYSPQLVGMAISKKLLGDVSNDYINANYYILLIQDLGIEGTPGAMNKMFAGVFNEIGGVGFMGETFEQELGAKGVKCDNISNLVKNIIKNSKIENGAVIACAVPKKVGDNKDISFKCMVLPQFRADESGNFNTSGVQDYNGTIFKDTKLANSLYRVLLEKFFKKN